jgi:hypothetical protein
MVVEVEKGDTPEEVDKKLEEFSSNIDEDRKARLSNTSVLLNLRKMR